MICVHCSSPVPDEARFCHSCGSLVSDAGGQAAATAAMDKNAFAHLEELLREEIKGEFTLGKMLGRGGMAVVYLATETHLSRKVALKVLPPELTFGHGVDRFMREAKTAAALDHPHIIPIYRIGSGGKIFWYAMKFLEGRSLDDVLKEQGAYGLDETIEILEQVADALDYAHAHQVIHRDIKPANIMLDQRDRVVVTDFGIAKALTEGALTASGSVIGTPYFMSPEQGMGKPVAGAADQYSVGVMAYRMLAGHVPFDGDSAIDILHKHCMAEAPRLEEEMPHIPKHVCDAIDKALSKKADDRFPTVSDFVAAMKDPDHQYARPSVKTVILSADELKSTSGEARKTAAKKALATKAAAKGTAAKGAKTVLAGAKVVPQEAPKKSRAAIFAALGVLVLGGGGYAGWSVMNKADANATPAQYASGDATLGKDGGPGGDSTPTTATAPVVTAPTTAIVPPPVVTPPQQTVTREPAPNPPPTTRREQPRREPVTPPTQTPTQQAPPPAQTPAQTPAASTPPAGTATLQLSLNPPGNVSIDGVPHGERGRYSTEITPGTHRISVEKAGFITKDTTITVAAGARVTIRLSMEARP